MTTNLTPVELDLEGAALNRMELVWRAHRGRLSAVDDLAEQQVDQALTARPRHPLASRPWQAIADANGGPVPPHGLGTAIQPLPLVELIDSRTY